MASVEWVLCVVRSIRYWGLSLSNEDTLSRSTLVVFFSAEDDLVGDSCIPPRCYRPGYGRNTLFFIWNAIIIGFEYAIGGAALFQLLKKHLPLILLSLLVSAPALPFAHLFTNDYVRSDFFKDGQIGFPLAVIIKTSWSPMRSWRKQESDEQFQCNVLYSIVGVWLWATNVTCASLRDTNPCNLNERNRVCSDRGLKPQISYFRVNMWQFQLGRLLYSRHSYVISYYQ